MHARARSAFSLVEVVVAVGILAIAVTSLLALLTSIQRRTSEAAEHLDAIAAMETAAAVFKAEGSAVVSARAVAPGASSSAGERFYLTRDCSAWGWGNAVAAANRFYAVTIERLDDISDANPNASHSIVAATLRVEWPAAALDDSEAGVSVLRWNYVFPR